MIQTSPPPPIHPIARQRPERRRVRHFSGYADPETAYKRLGASVMTGALTTIREASVAYRRSAKALAALRDLLDWLDAGQDDHQHRIPIRGTFVPLTFEQVCEQNRLDPVVARQRILGHIPPEVVEAAKKPRA
jgi:hypothetical protein